MAIPFNKPPILGTELEYIRQVLNSGRLSGDGPFTRRCHAWLEAHTGSAKALLTHSCTAALEMAALLIDTQPGDEIIMPSYTFVSTANAFVLRGGIPVFVDIRPDTLNLDESLIEAAITPRSKAIAPVHYAGAACEMDTMLSIAKKHGLYVVEDAAQCMLSTYKGRALGSIGHLGAYSFHESKNIVSGEGGALLVNDSDFAEAAEIIREKGTDRSRFFRGQVDKYTWQSPGSSYLPGELIAAFLLAQLERAEELTRQRMHCWAAYHAAFADEEAAGFCRRPILPQHCEHNAHMYYLLLPSLEARRRFIEGMHQHGVSTVFHYVALHSCPAGRKLCRTAGELPVTDRVSSTLVRLPMFAGLVEVQDEVIANAKIVLKSHM
jgi:dTDP-4-amino-4,6-dideoxygalactose transaminase